MESASVEDLRELISDELYEFCTATASNEAKLPSTSTGNALYYNESEL